MTSYYYPFGYTANITQVGYTPIAGRADTASMYNITVPTASFASIAINTPPAGASGSSATSAGCATAPAGAKGATGASGLIAGTSILSCSVGTVECALLTPPAGYSKVCIEIPVGCPNTVICPDSLTEYAPPYCVMIEGTWFGGNPGGGNEGDCGGEYPTSLGTLYGPYGVIESGSAVYTGNPCTSTFTTTTHITNGSSYYAMNGSGIVSSTGTCSS